MVYWIAIENSTKYTNIFYFALNGIVVILTQIRDYVDGKGPDVPLILLGGPGSGKSSIMAKTVDNTLTAAIDQKIAG